MFGVGHAYQGAAGIVKTGLVGLGFAGLYVLTDSIWVPIAGHIIWDLLQGRTMKELMSGD